MNYKKIIAVIVSVLVCILPSTVGGKDIESRIKENIQNYRKDLPKDVGRGIKLVRLTLQDDYSIYNGESKKVVHWEYKYQLDDRYTDKYKLAQLERISTIVSVCDLALTITALKHNFISKYTFNDDLGNNLVEFFLGSEECDDFRLKKGSMALFQKNWTNAHESILPVRLDEFTELLTVSAGQKVIKYVTRLPIFSKAQLNADAPSLLSEHSRESFCSSPDLKVLFSYGFKSLNLFIDKNMEEIVLSETKPSDCK